MLTGHIETRPQDPAVLAGPSEWRVSLQMEQGGFCGLRKGHPWVSRQPRARGVGTERRAAASTKTQSLGGKDQRKASPWGGDHQELPFSPIPRPPTQPGPRPTGPSPSWLHFPPAAGADPRV